MYYRKNWRRGDEVICLKESNWKRYQFHRMTLDLVSAWYLFVNQTFTLYQRAVMCVRYRKRGRVWEKNKASPLISFKATEMIKKSLLDTLLLKELSTWTSILFPSLILSLNLISHFSLLSCLFVYGLLASGEESGWHRSYSNPCPCELTTPWLWLCSFLCFVSLTQIS